FTSTFVFIGAVVYIILAPKGREDPATLRGIDLEAEKVDEPEKARAAEPDEDEALVEWAGELVRVATATGAGAEAVEGKDGDATSGDGAPDAPAAAADEEAEPTEPGPASEELVEGDANQEPAEAEEAAAETEEAVVPADAEPEPEEGVLSAEHAGAGADGEALGEAEEARREVLEIRHAEAEAPGAVDASAAVAEPSPEEADALAGLYAKLAEPKESGAAEASAAPQMLTSRRMMSTLLG